MAYQGVGPETSLYWKPATQSSSSTPAVQLGWIRKLLILTTSTSITELILYCKWSWPTLYPRFLTVVTHDQPYRPTLIHIKHPYPWCTLLTRGVCGRFMLYTFGGGWVLSESVTGMEPIHDWMKSFYIPLQSKESDLGSSMQILIPGVIENYFSSGEKGTARKDALTVPFKHKHKQLNWNLKGDSWSVFTCFFSFKLYSK